YEDMPCLQQAAERMPALLCENFARTLPEFPLKEIVNAAGHALPPWNGEVAGLVSELEPLKAQGYSVTVLAGTPRAAEALARDLRERGFGASTAADLLPGP